MLGHSKNRGHSQKAFSLEFPWILVPDCKRSSDTGLPETNADVCLLPVLYVDFVVAILGVVALISDGL